MNAFLGLPEFIFDLAGKFSAAFLLFTATLLFLPAQIIDDHVLQSVRNLYKTELWVGLLFSASLFLSYIGKTTSAIVIQKINACINDRNLKKKRKNNLQRVIDRLKSLDQRELLWIKYCLYKNQQTISCAYTDRTANSLENKGILSQGSGSVLSLPYTVKDEVWAYLKNHQSEYLPEKNQKQQKEFAEELRNFEKSFRLV
ncbi:MAG: hypothetical protein FGM21_15010 [Limnohabitans sp.]|nr:hypothetical protein [Limnohabitans sp.]